MTVEPGQGVYAATKAGLVQLLRTAAAELGPCGVRVNAVAPGVVETPLTAQIRAAPDWYDAYAQQERAGPVGAADELAGAVAYLASDAASFVTGTRAVRRRRLDRGRRPLRAAGLSGRARAARPQPWRGDHDVPGADAVVGRGVLRV